MYCHLLIGHIISVDNWAGTAAGDDFLFRGSLLVTVTRLIEVILQILRDSNYCVLTPIDSQ